MREDAISNYFIRKKKGRSIHLRLSVTLQLKRFLGDDGVCLTLGKQKECPTSLQIRSQRRTKVLAGKGTIGPTACLVKSFEQGYEPGPCSQQRQYDACVSAPHLPSCAALVNDYDVAANNAPSVHCFIPGRLLTKITFTISASGSPQMEGLRVLRPLIVSRK